jgi:hypothetical protein
MLLLPHQNAGQNHDIKTANMCFEIVVQLRYLGTTITNHNLIQEEIKRTLKSGNACYYPVQNLFFSSRLVSKKNMKIRIYKTIILLVVLSGCETWSLALGEEHRLRVFQNRVMRKYLDRRGSEGRLEKIT